MIGMGGRRVKIAAGGAAACVQQKAWQALLACRQQFGAVVGQAVPWHMHQPITLAPPPPPQPQPQPQQPAAASQRRLHRQQSYASCSKQRAATLQAMVSIASQRKRDEGGGRLSLHVSSLLF